MGNSFQFWGFAQGAATAVALFFVWLVAKSFGVGSIWQEFETIKQWRKKAGADLSDLTSEMNGLPERCRQEMRQELDRQWTQVILPKFEEARQDRERMWEVIERRRGPRS